MKINGAELVTSFQDYIMGSSFLAMCNLNFGKFYVKKCKLFFFMYFNCHDLGNIRKAFHISLTPENVLREV